MTTKDTISGWYDAGVALGATHMVIVADTFGDPWEDYPVYVTEGQSAAQVAAEHDEKNMQKVIEVYNFSLDKESQMAEYRALHY